MRGPNAESAAHVCRGLTLSLLARQEQSVTSKSIWASVTALDGRISRDICYKAVDVLVRQGLVGKTDNGQFEITPQGMSCADFKINVPYVFAPYGEEVVTQARPRPVMVTKVEDADKGLQRLRAVYRSAVGGHIHSMWKAVGV